jgi:hypothetical protein
LDLRFYLVGFADIRWSHVSAARGAFHAVSEHPRIWAETRPVWVKIWVGIAFAVLAAWALNTAATAVRIFVAPVWFSGIAATRSLLKVFSSPT